MNEELQKALATILNKATKGVEAGVDFLSQQLPDVIHQLLLYHAVRSALLCAMFIILIVTVLVTVYRKEKEWKKDSAFERGLGWLFGIMASMLLSMGVFKNMEWLQIWLAPKLYLIEYAAQLVSK